MDLMLSEHFCWRCFLRRCFLRLHGVCYYFVFILFCVKVCCTKKLILLLSTFYCFGYTIVSTFDLCQRVSLPVQYHNANIGQTNCDKLIHVTKQIESRLQWIWLELTDRFTSITIHLNKQLFVAGHWFNSEKSFSIARLSVSMCFIYVQ